MIPSDVHSAPRGANEDEWLEVAAGLVAQLEKVAGPGIVLGAYWGTTPGISFNCRLRSKHPVPGIASDSWEAALSVDGDERGTWADLDLFPFLDGSAVDHRGRVAGLGADAKLERSWWLQLAGGQWQQRGWRAPDGPGEWSWVAQPGDAYVESLECEVPKKPVCAGEPLTIGLAVARTTLGGSEVRARASLLFASRGRARVSPACGAPPRSSSRRAFDISKHWDPRKGGGHLDLRALKVCGGWQPGKYRLALRLQLADELGCWHSTISAPFTLEVR